MKILILEQDRRTLDSLGHVFSDHDVTLVHNNEEFTQSLFYWRYDKILVNIDYLGSVLETIKLLGLQNVVYTTASTIDFGVAPVLKKPYGVDDIERLVYT